MSNTMYEIATALGTMLSLLGLWMLVFWLLRNYHIDAFRQRMFDLRNDLFDEAHAGLIEFDNPAYGLLRQTCNGFIRFAHKLTLGQLLVAWFWIDRQHGVASERTFATRWEKSMHTLPHVSRERLLWYRNEMNKLVLWHMLKSSPVTSFVILPVLAFALVIYFVARRIIEGLIDTLLDVVDSTAMIEGKMAES